MLVGRTTELTALVDVVARRPSVVLVEGEAGMGKTRLLRELVQRPELDGLRVLAGTCQPLREPFPYGPVLDALRELAGPVPGALSPVAGVLRPLLPEIADHLPPRPEPLPDEIADRHRQFRAIRELLTACGPALLVVDDVHWADERTKELLRFLVASPPPNLGLVIAHRDDPASSAGVFGAPFRPAGTVRVARVHLGPLDVPAVRKLATAILDVPRIDEDFATKLHECTAGIPFVVEETLHALRESPSGGGFSHRLLDAIEVPVLLREAMAERLATLPDAAVRLVRAAAVLAVPAEAALIGTVAGARGARMPVALTDAVHSGVLHEIDNGRYGFRHALARKAVYDTISGPERQVLHGKALRALAETVPQPLVQLAGHAQAGGLTDQWRQYAEAAADRAIEVGETALAIDTLQSLLEGAELDEPDVERMAEKLSKIALRGLRADVTVTLERVLAERGLRGKTRGAIRLSMGMLLVRRPGELARGRREVEKAIEELADRPELAARGMNLLAQPLDGLTPLAWHEDWARRADDVVARLDDPELRLTLLADRIACRAHIGDGSAWPEFEAMPEHTATVSERVQLSRLWCNLADAQSWSGHVARAERLLRTGMSMATTAGAVSMAEIGRATRLRLDWISGNWSGLAENGSALLEKYPDLRPVAGEVSLVLGSLAVVRGEFADAERHLASTFVSAPEFGVIPVVLSAAAVLVRIRLAADDPVAACDAADNALAAARRKGVWVWAADLVPSVVDAYAHAGRLAEAGDLIEEFAGGIAGRDAPLADAALLAARAALLEAEDKKSDAAKHFDEAAAHYATLPMPYPATWATERAALCRLATGADTATSELCDAAEAYEKLGATRDAGRCRHLLREHGAWTPSPRGRRGYGQQLSPRESEVARMLADGRTNREIADGLFLSPRTVEQHVAKVLRKLGARSRTEVVWLDHDVAGPVAVRLPRQGKAGRVSALS